MKETAFTTNRETREPAQVRVERFLVTPKNRRLKHGHQTIGNRDGCRRVAPPAVIRLRSTINADSSLDPRSDRGVGESHHVNARGTRFLRRRAAFVAKRGKRRGVKSAIARRVGGWVRALGLVRERLNRSASDGRAETRSQVVPPTDSESYEIVNANVKTILCKAFRPINEPQLNARLSICCGVFRFSDPRNAGLRGNVSSTRSLLVSKPRTTDLDRCAPAAEANTKRRCGPGAFPWCRSVSSILGPGPDLPLFRTS